MISVAVIGLLSEPITTGVAAVIGAAWVAVAAPVLGLAAKTTQNVISLDERQLATEAGLRALWTQPLGGHATEVQGGINLISDIAVSKSVECHASSREVKIIEDRTASRVEV